MKVLLLVIAFAAVSPVWNTDGASFNISLELQGDCSDQLTLICRHSEILPDPNWIHNRTVESGQVLSTAFPGAVYTVQSSTEHRVTISGVGNVTALDGNIIQCVYSILGDVIKSNAVKYSFIPPDYQPTLYLMSFTPDFSERFCTFNYSYEKSCSLYPRCTRHFSVEHTVSPPSPVNISFSGCSVEYTIHNLMRCVSYQSTTTTLIGSQRGNPIVMGDTVMQSPGQFTITCVSIGANRDLITVTYMENESDCLGYPTERYTVDVDGVQVVNMTANQVQSLAINNANGSVTLTLPLSQPLPEDAVTLSMTKYNTVPTNRSDVTVNIVTEMVTWGTSAVFDLSQESSAATNDKGEVSVGVVVGVVISVISVTNSVVITIAVALVIARKRKANKCGTCDLKATDTNNHSMTDEVDSEAVSEKKNIVSDELVEPPPAAETEDKTVKECVEEGLETYAKEHTKKVDEGADDYKFGRAGRMPKAATSRSNTEKSEEQEPTFASEADASGGSDACADGHINPEDVVPDKEVEPPPSPAAETEDDDVGEPEEKCHPATESTKATAESLSQPAAYVGGDGCKRIGRLPKVDLTREITAGRIESQETVKTICAFKNDPSTCYIYGDKDIPQGQRTTQGLTYVTVYHSERRPINVPNENLDVQYTGVRFATKAPAV